MAIWLTNHLILVVGIMCTTALQDDHKTATGTLTKQLRKKKQKQLATCYVQVAKKQQSPKSNHFSITSALN